MQAMSMKCRMLLASMTAAAAMAAGTGCGGMLTAEERSTAGEGVESALASYQALRVADSMFAFDPTIDPSRTADVIAAAIEARAQLQLGQCGTVTRNTNTVTVSFGPPPGCTLRNGTQISGSLTATITQATGRADVSLIFTDIVAGERSLTGSASFSTANGSSFTVILILTTNQGQVFASMNATGSPGTMTIDGNANVQRTTGPSGETTNSQVSFQGVVWKEGDCYPGAGSVAVTRGPTSVTITFSATTPTTGEATATSGRASSTIDLPAYGSCPPG